MRPSVTSFPGESDNEAHRFFHSRNDFLTHYLAAQRNLSPQYHQAVSRRFTLLLRFCRDGAASPGKARLEQIDVSWWKHSWITWRRKENLRHVRETIGLATLHAILPICSGRRPATWFNARKSSRFPTAARSPNGRIPFQKTKWLRSGTAGLRSLEGRRDAVLPQCPLRHRSACPGVIDLSVGDVRLTHSTAAPYGKRAQDARCPFYGQHNPACARPLQEPPRSSRTVRQTSFPERTRPTPITFGIRYILQSISGARSTLPSLTER